MIILAENHKAEVIQNPNATKAQILADKMETKGIHPDDRARGTDSPGVGQFMLRLPFATGING